MDDESKSGWYRYAESICHQIAAVIIDVYVDGLMYWCCKFEQHTEGAVIKWISNILLIAEICP